MKNYYQILEVSENASSEVIEKAYKVLAKKYHPDTYPKDKIYWAENKFKEITEAYNVLSDKSSRKDYDIKMGFNSYGQEQYTNLYNEQEKLKQEINNLKIKNKSYEYTNNIQKTNNSSKKADDSYFKKYVSSIGTLLYNETKKPKDERSKDLKALILTIIIVSVIIFIFCKFPFLNNLLFP